MTEFKPSKQFKESKESQTKLQPSQKFQRGKKQRREVVSKPSSESSSVSSIQSSVPSVPSVSIESSSMPSVPVESSELPESTTNVKTQKYEQSRTILRKLSAKANVKSLSTECYPLILNIIDDVLRLIMNKLMERQQKKTISITDIQPIIQQQQQQPLDKNFDVINQEFVPIFTRAAFKRQVKRCMEDKYRISPTALKLLQHNVEETIINILCVAQNISSNGNRKRVLKKDIELAWQMRNKYQQD